MRPRYIKLLYVFLLCSGVSTWLPAQIHQPRQRFLELGGGLIDGVQVKKGPQTGYWVRASLGRYGKKEGIWQAGLSTQWKYYPFACQLIRIDEYFLEGAFTPKVFQTRDRSVYVGPGVGPLIGYERVPELKGEERSRSLSKFLVGLSGQLTGEWNLSDHLALIAYTRAHYLPSSAVQKFHFQYGFGFRFNYFKP